MTNAENGVAGNDSPYIDLDSVSDLALRRAIITRRMKKGIKWSWKDFIAIVAIFYVLSVIVILIVAFQNDTNGNSLYEKNDFWWIVAGVVFAIPLLTAVIQGYVIAFQRLFLAVNAASAGVADASAKATELQDSLGDDFVTNLVKINFKYIDQYYLQTQQQADRSFSLSLWVSIAGFAIVAIGIALAIFSGGSSAYVATGAGIISEFIAAVFFYLYSQTVLSMGNYHRKLVITQNIALALKISEGLPDAQRADAQTSLVKTLTADVNNLLTLEGGYKTRI